MMSYTRGINGKAGVFCLACMFILLFTNTQLQQNSEPRKVEYTLQKSCDCKRTKKMYAEPYNKTDYARTTCGREAYARGPHQKVVAFSFFGNPSTAKHKSKKYFQGITENLADMPKYYPGWVMRVYHDLTPIEPLYNDLCMLACVNDNIDLCNIRSLPGNPVKDASKIFPMNWRFFPTLDHQVDLYVSRDLDSRFSIREKSAVEEWLSSGLPLHTMRDHPAHGTPVLGGLWGTRLDQPGIREKWKRSWDLMFADDILYAESNSFGPDQTMLKKYIWSWGESISLQHDSYLCNVYPNTTGWPTQRLPGLNNFVGSVIGNPKENQIWEACPPECRRQQDWEQC